MSNDNAKLSEAGKIIGCAEQQANPPQTSLQIPRQHTDRSGRFACLLIVCMYVLKMPTIHLTVVITVYSQCYKWGYKG